MITYLNSGSQKIRLRTEDRDVLRFLWWENAECSKIRIYRYCRLVFGVSSSPFLLNATISYHLEREKFLAENLRNTIGHLKERFCVDNLVTSVNDVTELEQLKSQFIEIMKEGAVELRCWASNDSKKDQDMQMVLGLSCDVVSDELSCKLPSNLDCTQERPVTKRVLVSMINSVYDPIGFTAPALLLPKLLMQEAWRGKIGWDEVLPVELEHKYRLWEKTMHLMSKCTIPRRFFAENYDDFTLHIFTDTYATCAFLRCEFKGQVTIKLIAAKARLAPMKKPTIPRLELLGAAPGARLAETVHSILRTASKTYFDDWRHVPGEVNPANHATRCCDWSDLLKSKCWEGPGWLYSDEESWPCSEVSETPNEAFLERRKTVVTNLATGNEVIFGDRFLYFSSCKKILRMAAYVLKFCNNIKRNSPKLTAGKVNPDPSPLPPDRIHRVTAFQITGADLASPLSLRGGNSVDSSIHVCSVSRRGRGSTLYTDNGTNFVGAANALKSLDWDFIQAECSLMKIKWLFSPPSAPWYGVFWERMVRSIKELFRKCLGEVCVTYEEMLTLLYDWETTINGRPLTYLSDDPKELKPLTPAHFIQDIKERETFDLDLIDSQHLLKRVRYVHTLRSNLRKRYYKEYFGELVI
ncbi:dual 3',5'-cyclic-AMP and-GMP phosphodiesterase 11 [Trichonephila clavipes]|nr:dual 3',5'-cyclic-AMP and-GMP phosphodiesterase 11 [Trichonephila clavipes]